MTALALLNTGFVGGAIARAVDLERVGRWVAGTAQDDAVRTGALASVKRLRALRLMLGGESQRRMQTCAEARRQ